MNPEKIEREFRKELQKDDHKDPEPGLYFPSEVSGCPLKVYLNRMTRNEVDINSYLFQGAAVHYYLQETGKIANILHRCGYHALYTEYEIASRKEIADGVVIRGRCDVHAIHDDGHTAIFDLKYSSIPADSGHGRLYTYYSQANIYSHLFDTDEYALIMIHSSSGDSDKFLDKLTVLEGNKSEDNWELVKDKTTNIHEALVAAGYNDDNEWSKDELAEVGVGFWEEVTDHFDLDRIPSYGKECQYCPHKEYCPVNNDKITKGVANLFQG